MNKENGRSRLETDARGRKGRGLTLIELRNAGGLGSGLHRMGSMTSEFEEMLKTREARIEPITIAGEALIAQLHHPLFFGDLPRALTSEVMQATKRKGLSIIPVPDFTPQMFTKLTEPEDKNGSIFPEEYGAKIGRGEIAKPHKNGYYIFTESPGETPIAYMLQICPGATIDEINRAIRKNQKEILRQYNIPEGEAYIRMATLKELSLDNALYGIRPGTTSTKVRGKEEYFYFDGKKLSTISMDDPVKDPRFVIVFGPPLQEYEIEYLPPAPAETSVVAAEAEPAIDVFVDSSRELSITP